MIENAAPCGSAKVAKRPTFSISIGGIYVFGQDQPQAVRQCGVHHGKGSAPLQHPRLRFVQREQRHRHKPWQITLVHGNRFGRRRSNLHPYAVLEYFSGELRWHSYLASASSPFWSIPRSTHAHIRVRLQELWQPLRHRPVVFR